MITDGLIIKQNDTLPLVSVIVRNEDGSVIDLTGCTATFTLADEFGTVLFSRAAVITAPTAGAVEYRWQTGDTDTAGRYKGEFKITFSDSKRLTAPNGDYIEVWVVKELA